MTRPNAALQVVSSQSTDQQQHPRYIDGWRRGKPEEDPEKLKRWGFISAKPSEFLVRMRGGSVVASGQGATTFKWPWDSVAVIPTTVQRLQFTADQITREKIGVKVTGIVVYRIAEPLIAFRMLNFSFPERAQEKLATMMEEMCIGATRRLVANLSVEECLTRRKDAIAGELIHEVAPVVSGSGALEDQTERGWGLVVDTIEIQDVRVLSAAVFTNMQARFRTDQERMAREAELARELAVKTGESNTERQIALSRVTSQTEVRRQTQAAEEAARLEKIAAEARVEEQRLAQDRAARTGQLEVERDLAQAKLAAEADLKQRRQAAEEQAALEKVTADARLATEKLSAELHMQQERLKARALASALEAQAALAEHQGQIALETQHAELTRAQSATAEARLQLAQLEARTAEVEVQRQELQHRLELDRASRQKAIDNSLSPEVIQLAIANKLPELAAAFQQKMGEVHVTAIDGANPFGYVAAAVEGVMGLARSAGLKVPKVESK